MRIVVNHLTRMSMPRICVAGIEASGVRHVRPVTRQSDLLTRRLLVEEGGPFAIGALVDLGRAVPSPAPPEVEDHRIDTRDLRYVRTVDGSEYLDLLDASAAPDLVAAFGEHLERRGWKYAVEPGRGIASLAVVKARRRATVEIDRYGKVQLRLADVSPATFLRITDVRFAEADHQTVRTDVVVDVQRRLRRGIGLYVMVGLARAFAAEGDDRERHWLQVNGLCLEDRPVGPAP